MTNGCLRQICVSCGITSCGDLLYTKFHQWYILSKRLNSHCKQIYSSLRPFLQHLFQVFFFFQNHKLDQTLFLITVFLSTLMTPYKIFFHYNYYMHVRYAYTVLHTHRYTATWDSNTFSCCPQLPHVYARAVSNHLTSVTPLLLRLVMKWRLNRFTSFIPAHQLLWWVKKRRKYSATKSGHKKVTCDCYPPNLQQMASLFP